MDTYLVIALLGQMLGGVVMAVGLILGVRLALPSLARTLVRELDAARLGTAEQADVQGRPVVTLERGE